MPLPLLFPIKPDFADDYWLLSSVPQRTATVNGCKIHLDHQQRVLDARLIADLAESVTAFPSPDAGRE